MSCFLRTVFLNHRGNTGLKLVNVDSTSFCILCMCPLCMRASLWFLFLLGRKWEKWIMYRKWYTTCLRCDLSCRLVFFQHVLISSGYEQPATVTAIRLLTLFPHGCRSFGFLYLWVSRGKNVKHRYKQCWV